MAGHRLHAAGTARASRREPGPDSRRYSTAVTDWQEIAGSDFAVPAGADRDELAAELSAALADPDPEVRDGPAYAVLFTWLARGELPDQLDWLGTQAARRLEDPQIQARTFAPLVLAGVVEAGAFDESWVSAFERWYPAETDLRGHDPGLGWLHAVAHGADLLGTLGCHDRVRPERMLRLAAARMLAGASYVWRDQEDDRLGHAIALILTRPGITSEQSTSWLAPVDETFAAGEPGPVPPFASNTMRTLRLLYLLADRGVRAERDGGPRPLAHRTEVKDSVARTLAAVTWFSG
jgi:hypothetical protein